MKVLITCLLGAGLMGLLAGCAHAPAMGGGGGGGEFSSYTQSTGAEQWQPDDYRWTLSDPGPF